MMGAGVVGGGLFVGETAIVAGTWVILFTNGTGDSWVTLEVDVPTIGGRSTDLQACKSTMSTQAMIQLFRTDAVYHKMHYDI